MFVDEKKLGEVTVKESKARQNLQKVIEALRSGNYQQTFDGGWDDGEGACCAMGVVAKVMGKDCDKLLNEAPSRHYFPPRFLKSVGLTGEEESQIMKMNDDLNWSFDKIADWIEATVLPNVK